MTDGIFLLLGCNIGDRIAQLESAERLLGDYHVITVRRSMVYETAAWGPIPQEPFLNRVLQVETPLTPEELLEILLTVERKLGRERRIKWGPRIIDIDLLYYNQEIIRTDSLTIPHPFIPERRFTLAPLAEIAPGFIHPVLKKDQETLLRECKDELEAKAITGRRT